MDSEETQAVEERGRVRREKTPKPAQEAEAKVLVMNNHTFPQVLDVIVQRDRLRDERDEAVAVKLELGERYLAAREEAEKLRAILDAAWSVFVPGATQDFADGVWDLADTIRSKVYMRGELSCPKCSFALHKRFFVAATGETGVPLRTAEPEPCPNGCGPLEPVSWEDAFREMLHRAEELARRLGERGN